MNERQQIREAAESLLCSVSPYNRNISHSQSINLVHDDLVAGLRPLGRMSTIRRFFCLYVTFDLLFTGLMWLICVMMKGEALIQIFNREIVNYNIKISLFDIVIVAILRFVFLLLFYAIFYINNWSVIALSTGGTCVFVLAKVFLYDWPDASQPVFCVLLILGSFVLAWGEAWFLDFRVLPQEMKAKCFLDAIGSHAPARTERTPLLSAPGDSTVRWFSPVETPEASPRPPRPRPLLLTDQQIEEYKALAERGLRDAWQALHGGGWRAERRGAVRGDVVESAPSERHGKLYRFTGLVDCPPRFLYEEFKNNVTKLPEWNPTILKSEIIKSLADGIDISYQVTAGGGRGIISARDFVILRRVAPLDAAGAVCDVEHAQGFISSGVSVDVPGFPPAPNMVRGVNKVGCWYIRPQVVRTAAGLETKTQFQWLMCVDLKGKIPQFILDAAFATVMLDYIVHVRKLAAESKAKGLF